MEKIIGMAGVFLSDAGRKISVLNTAEKLLNTVALRVHSDTPCCLTMEVCALNNGFALFNSFSEVEVLLFPVFRLFSSSEMQKTG
jgi:hypothetical protein